MDMKKQNMMKKAVFKDREDLIVISEEPSTIRNRLPNRKKENNEGNEEKDDNEDNSEYSENFSAESGSEIVWDKPLPSIEPVIITETTIDGIPGAPPPPPPPPPPPGTMRTKSEKKTKQLHWKPIPR